MEIKIKELVREQTMAGIIVERDAIILDLYQQLLVSKAECDKLAEQVKKLTPQEGEKSEDKKE